MQQTCVEHFSEASDKEHREEVVMCVGLAETLGQELALGQPQTFQTDKAAKGQARTILSHGRGFQVLGHNHK